MTGEDKAEWQDLVRATVNCRVREITIVLHLIAVTICKSQISRITNPNPMSSHWKKVSCPYA
jgi:hypothetical protein